MSQERIGVVDADGHVFERYQELKEHLEGRFRGLRRLDTFPLFPTLDGWPRGLLAPDAEDATDLTDGSAFWMIRGWSSPSSTRRLDWHAALFRAPSGRAPSRAAITTGSTSVISEVRHASGESPCFRSRIQAPLRASWNTP